MPEHGPPAGRQRLEGPGDQRPLEPGDHRVGGKLARIGQLLVVGGDLGELVAAPVIGHAPDRGQQVGPERPGRAAAAADDVEDPGEGVGHHVVRVGRAPGEPAGLGAGRLRVPLIQGGVGVGPARAHRRDQVAVPAGWRSSHQVPSFPAPAAMPAPMPPRRRARGLVARSAS
jgi:hypothetical protein